MNYTPIKLPTAGKVDSYQQNTKHPNQKRKTTLPTDGNVDTPKCRNCLKTVFTDC